MSVVPVVVLVVVLAMAATGLAGVVGLFDLNDVRVDGQRTTAAQRRFALARLRGRGRRRAPAGGLEPGQVALVDAVDAVAAGRRAGVGLVWTFAGSTLTATGLALSDGVWPLGIAAAAFSVAVAVALGLDRLRAGRYLAERAGAVETGR